MAGATLAAHWYVLQSKVHKEEVLWQRLRARGYGVFYPRLFVHNKRTKSLKIKPYFPGYLFVNINLDEVSVSSFQWMPDAVGLVSFEEKPAWVPDHFIQAVQEHLKEVAALGERLLVGFDEGELPSGNGSYRSSYQAIFDSRLSGKDRVRALYQMLRDEVSVPSESNPAQ
jgi:transcriptional antiterminator RfaH